MSELIVGIEIKNNYSLKLIVTPFLEYLNLNIFSLLMMKI